MGLCSRQPQEIVCFTGSLQGKDLQGLSLNVSFGLNELLGAAVLFIYAPRTSSWLANER